MCTNFTPTKKNGWVKFHFGVELSAQDYPEQAFPSYPAPIVVQSHNTGRIACGLARFGLIPAWAKDEKISRHTYNARSETVAEKPSYRTAWRNRQFGLVLVDNFYEPCYETGKAVRTEIRLESGEPFAIACLWDRWKQPETGELVVSFSMLTVNADVHPVMKRFHKAGDEKRTPVIVPDSQYIQWLGASVEQAGEMMNLAQMPVLHVD
jgi:putative SOS response-associated peptidase YedK